MFIDHLADFLFPDPDTCIICGAQIDLGDPLLCPRCISHLRKPFRIAERICAVCGIPIEQDTHVIREPKSRFVTRPNSVPGRIPATAALSTMVTCSAPTLATCPECRRAPHAYSRVHPAAIYREPVRKIVHALKYGGRPEYSKALAHLMVVALEAKAVDIIVPVPLHISRLAERQYNQAALLAGRIARRLKLPVAEALRKTKQPASQSLLSRRERLMSLDGVFVPAGAKVGRRVEGRRVLLVDDVFTTGSTVHHCAAVLRQMGAADVQVSVAAIQPLRSQPESKM